MTEAERTAALVDGAPPRDEAERALGTLMRELREDAPAAPGPLRARVRELARAAPAGAPGGAGRRWRRWRPNRRATLVGAPLVAALAALAVVVGVTSLGPGGDTAPAPSLDAPARERLADSGAEAAPSGAAAARQALEAPLAPGVDASRPQDVSTQTVVRLPDADALAEATATAMRDVRALGGFTATLDQRAGAGGAARARIVARVPVARVETALARFAGLGTPLSQRAQIADLGDRLDEGDRAARRLEARLDELRADLRRDPDSRVLLAELRRTRDELAALLDAQAGTRAGARLATLNLTLVAPREAAALPPGRFEDALRSGADALGAAVAGALRVLVVTAPLWLLGLTLAAWRLHRRRSERRLLAG